MMQPTQGVAFAGAGFISYLHNFALRLSGAGKLVALASNSRRVAEHRATLFDAAPYTLAEIDAMVSRPDVGAVFVLTPNAMHAEHTLRAIEAGKHVVVEKPLALTLTEADRILEAARERGVSVGYAENQLFAPVIERARAAIAEGAVGKVLRVVGFCGNEGPPGGGWFWDPKLAGGGAQFDMGAHTVEVALHLAGKPRVVAVEHVSVVEHPSGLDGRGEAVLHAEDGIELHVTSSFVEPFERIDYEVHGDRGVLRCVFAPAPFAQRLTITDHDGKTTELPIPHHDEMLRVKRYAGSMGYVGQAEHFLRCFRTGEPPVESAADGARVLEILLAIYLAAGRGRSVDPREIPRDVPPIALWKGTR